MRCWNWTIVLRWRNLQEQILSSICLPSLRDRRIQSLNFSSTKQVVVTSCIFTYVVLSGVGRWAERKICGNKYVFLRYRSKPFSPKINKNVNFNAFLKNLCDKCPHLSTKRSNICFMTFFLSFSQGVGTTSLWRKPISKLIAMFDFPQNQLRCWFFLYVIFICHAFLHSR